MAAKIKSGDLVKVIRGKDRGKEGTVKQVLKDDRLIVEGVQIVKKHVRATQQGQQAGIVAVEAPIHRSNVMVIDPETKQPKDVIVPELEKEFKYSNPMQVARVQKVVVSMGVGAAARDSKLIEGAVKDLTLITGQKPKITKAKKSVAQFHLREGQAIGAYVTLRGERMWEFLDRLLTMALPRIRDFRGINGDQFDGQGNYNFGLTEQSMFHEIDPDSIDHQRGMDITVVTSTKDDKEARVLLKHLGFPFKEN